MLDHDSLPIAPPAWEAAWEAASHTARVGSLESRLNENVWFLIQPIREQLQLVAGDLALAHVD